MENNSCTHQFTGGRDSVLTAIRLVEEKGFKNIHLLTFKTDLMTDLNNVYVNINRLKKYFKGRAKFTHKIINSQDLHRILYQHNYNKNVRTYKTFYVSTFCPCCRFSHHAHTIVYCLKNNIKYASDGSNQLTGFDLFQQPWAVKRIYELYKEFNIEYLRLIFNEKVPSEIQLDAFNKIHNVSNPFVASQPRCLGGGQFHNLYLRCFYFPMKGKKKYIETTTKWIDEKYPTVINHISDHMKLIKLKKK